MGLLALETLFQIWGRGLWKGDEATAFTFIRKKTNESIDSEISVKKNLQMP